MKVRVIEASTVTGLEDKVNQAIKGQKVLDIKFQIEENTYNVYKVLIVLE